MQVPILKQGDTLVVAIQADLTDDQLDYLRTELARKVGLFRSRGIVVDVSAMDVLDSFATRTLLTVAKMASLRGAQVVIVGIQPEVAYSMVQLGLTLEGVETALDLEEGLELLSMHTSSRNTSSRNNRGGAGRGR